MRRGPVVSVTRDDPLGEHIGHTAPQASGVWKKAMGGALFIDEACCVYRPEHAHADRRRPEHHRRVRHPREPGVCARFLIPATPILIPT